MAAAAGTGDEGKGAERPTVASRRLTLSPSERRPPRRPGTLDRWSPLAVHALALGLTAGVALADAASGEYALQPFYLAPVALVAWRLGRGSAMLYAGLAAAAWLAAQPVSGLNAGPALFWNALGQLGVFLVVALAVVGVRSLTDHTRSLAGTDHLTGVLDGESFQELVELERSRALRYNRPFTLAYLDVDRLRGVNDLSGHTTGDHTLRLIADTVRENIRSMDSVARLGGDEFGLLFPETGRGSAEIVLGKLRACLDREARERNLPITFSVGAIICVGAPESVDRLIQRADALMYQVKDRGGDGMAVEVLDDQFGIEAILQRS